MEGIIDLIKSLGGPDGFDDVLHPSNVEMTLEIVAKNLRQGKNEPYMDNLAGTFRHCPDVDLSMDLVGGGTVTSKDYRISHPLIVPGTGGIPDSTVLFEKIHAMLQGLLTEGRISFNP